MFGRNSQNCSKFGAGTRTVLLVVRGQHTLTQAQVWTGNSGTMSICYGILYISYSNISSFLYERCRSFWRTMSVELQISLANVFYVPMSYMYHNPTPRKGSLRLDVNTPSDLWMIPQSLAFCRLYHLVCPQCDGHQLL